MQLQGMNYQRANGTRGTEGNQGLQGKRPPRGEKPEGKPEEKLESNKLSKDSYTPSTQARSYAAEETAQQSTETPEEVTQQAQRSMESPVATMSETDQGVASIDDADAKLSDATYTDAADLENALLKKYEGMTDFNITIDDALLTEIQTGLSGDTDAKAAAVAKLDALEGAIAAQIEGYESYDGGDWTLVHAEMHITDVDTDGTLEQTSLQVLGSGDAIDAMFKEKYAADELINSIERMLIEDDSLSTDQRTALTNYADALDKVYNGTNSVTGYPNFLNEALLGPEHVTSTMVAENEALLGGLKTAYDALKAEVDGLTDGSALETSLDAIVDDADHFMNEDGTANASKTPLYSVSFGNIEVNFDSDEAEAAYNANLDAAKTDSLFYPAGELVTTEAELGTYKEFMLKSNQNLLNMMTELGLKEDDNKTTDEIWAAFLEKLQNPEEDDDETETDPDLDVDGSPVVPETTETPAEAEAS